MIVITIILVLLFLCVAAVTVIQKREQEKARIRQLIANHRMRANEAGDLLNDLAQLPIGLETRKILLQYMLSNIKVASSYAPKDEYLNRNVASIKNQLAHPENEVDQAKLTIPSDPKTLKMMIGRLNILSKYLLKLKASGVVELNLIGPANIKVQLITNELNIYSYLNQGKDFLKTNQFVPAQKCFYRAQQLLDEIKAKDKSLKVVAKEIDHLVTTTPTEDPTEPKMDETISADSPPTDANKTASLKEPSQLTKTEDKKSKETEKQKKRKMSQHNLFGP